MQEAVFAEICRVGAGQAKRQIDAERHRAAIRRSSQPVEKRRNLANQDRSGKPPDGCFAPRHRHPALARIDTPIRMRGDCQAVIR